VSKNSQEYIVRAAAPDEFPVIGELMVNVYSQLEGFPTKNEQPKYYKMLANIGSLTENPKTKLLIAISSSGKIGGGVVYFSDMKYYGSGGTATSEKNASGFRLLAVDPATRGQGIGKLLTKACIQMAKDEKQKQIIIHTTKAMQVAWKMYEKMGFKRSKDLDFIQVELPVFGFRLLL
jgi:GNAT superfamily N-acetyltransferase